MKAVVMAGGKGKRLKPASLEIPKPMMSLFGRPVLEHMLLLLRRHGITQVCITLHHLPQAVMDYFGTGSRLGMSLTYLVEDPALGTAGGVGACSKWLGSEDFLVVSGDIISDFNLGSAIE